jgi:hypothetical protein
MYIYNNLNSMWTLTAKLSRAGATYRDYFGHSVSIYDDLMVIGADGVMNSQGIPRRPLHALTSDRVCICL